MLGTLILGQLAKMCLTVSRVLQWEHTGLGPREVIMLGMGLPREVGRILIIEKREEKIALGMGIGR